MDEDELYQLAREATVAPPRVGDRPRTGFADREPIRRERGGGYDRLADFGRALFSKDAARSVAQGATLGFADEIEAGIRAPFSDRTYAEVRDDIRGQNDAFREEHPALGLGLELAGGVGAAGAAGRAARGLGALLGETRMATPIGRAATSIVSGPVRQGAVGGAVGGVGYSSEDGLDFGDALQGAAIGGGIGAGVRAVTAAPAFIRRGFQAATGSEEAIERGARSVVRREIDAAGGQDAVQRGLDALTGSTGAARILDAMPRSSRRVVRGAVTRGGTIGDEIADQVTARRDQAAERVDQLVRRGLGGDAIDVDDAALQIRQMAGELADRSYGEVLDRGALVEGPDLVRLLRNPTVRKAWERVAQIDRNLRDAGQAGRYHLDLWRDLPGTTGTGTNLPATVGAADDRATLLYDAFVDNASMDLGSADALKRGLDDVIRTGFDGQTPGGLKGETRSTVIALRDKLLSLADDADEAARRSEVGLSGRGTDVVRDGEAATLGKSYREARAEFATAMGWREALADGEQILTASPEEVRTLWAKLDPEQRQLALVGFRSKVLERLGRSDVGRDRTRGLLGSPDFQAKVRAMLGDRADEFLASLKVERGLADTDRFLTAGSNTADKLADAAGGPLRVRSVADAALAARSPGAAASYLLRQGAGAVDRLRGGSFGRVGDAAARQLTRPADEYGDVLTWLAQESRHWSDDLRDAGRRFPVAGVGGVAGGR